MIDSKRGSPAPDGVDHPADGIDEITRRLYDLLRDMSDEAPSADPSDRVGDGLLEAARRVWHAQRERGLIFGSGLAPDPAWEILLHLFIAMGEGREVSAASLAAETGLPQATVLRCIAHLVEARLVARHARPFEGDAMRLVLTDRAVAMMSQYLDRTMPAAGAAAA